MRTSDMDKIKILMKNGYRIELDNPAATEFGHRFKLFTRDNKEITLTQAISEMTAKDPRWPRIH